MAVQIIQKVLAKHEIAIVWACGVGGSICLILSILFFLLF